MNSENPRVLRTAGLLTNLRSLKSLENLLRLAVEGLGDLPNLPFSEEWVKRINIPKKRRLPKIIHPSFGLSQKVNNNTPQVKQFLNFNIFCRTFITFQIFSYIIRPSHAMRKNPEKTLK